MNRQRILICEDDPGLMALYERILGRDGWEVFPTSTCEESLSCIKQVHPQIVIMDLNMPGIGGAECCMRIKADVQTKDIPVVLVSASPELETIMHQVNADGYLNKPFSIPTLKNLLNNVIPPN